jgi:pilus assembly protein CpaB
MLRLSLAGVMVLAATAIALMFYASMDHTAPKVQTVSEPVPLLNNYFVASHSLPVGTLAREEDFATKAVPASDLPRGAILDTPDARAGLRGSLVRVFIDAGAPILSENILRPRERGFLASVLEPGTRAVSIAVDAVSGVSGLVWPGDHVDVVLTHEIENASLAHRALSEIVVADVRIIGIDQEIAQGTAASNTTAGKVAHTVTLQVSPQQVEQVMVAGHLGKLALSIRSAAEQPEVTSSRSMTFGGDVSPALAAQDNSPTVRVIQGKDEKEYTFKASGG